MGTFLCAGCGSWGGGVTGAEEATKPLAVEVAGSMFEAHDVNGDGVIEESEIVAVRTKDFAALDKDGDGKLSTDELAGKALLYVVAIDKDTFTEVEFAAEFVPAGTPEPTEEQVRKALENLKDAGKLPGTLIKWDIDGDGKVTPVEFKAFFIAVHRHHGVNSQAGRQKALKERYYVNMDVDNDGTVSLEEYTGKSKAKRTLEKPMR